MATYVIRLIGCRQELLFETEAPSVDDLAQRLSCNRFLVGRLLAIDGEVTSQAMGIAISRIEVFYEAE